MAGSKSQPAAAPPGRPYANGVILPGALQDGQTLACMLGSELLCAAVKVMTLYGGEVPASCVTFAALQRLLDMLCLSELGGCMQETSMQAHLQASRCVQMATSQRLSKAADAPW